MAEFIRYPSIENVRSGLVHKYTRKAPDEEWVALEKIHGANFAFVCTLSQGADVQVRLQRRNALLEAADAFYGAADGDHIQDIQTRVVALVLDLAQRGEARQQVTVFGELYGARVQHEIHYSPLLQFTCFDVCVDGTFWAYEPLHARCTALAIPCAQVLGPRAPLPTLVDTYSACIETLVSQYNPAAIAEGVVFRPFRQAYALSDRQERRMLKLKRALFTERRPASEIDAKADAVARGCAYVTPGREAAVRSKLLPSASFYEVAQALAADALADIEAGGDEDRTWWTEAPDAVQKRVRKQVTNAAFIQVKTALGLL